MAFCFDEKMDTPWNAAGRALLAEALHHHLKAQPNLRYDQKTMNANALNKLIPARVNTIQRSRVQKSQPAGMKQQRAQCDRVYGRRKSVSLS